MFSKIAFAKKLKELRQSKNLTGIELASKIGVSKGAISQWENGVALPSVDCLYDICEALQVEPSELIDYNDYKNNQINNQWREIETSYLYLNERQRETVKNVIKAQLGIVPTEKVVSLKLFDEPACAGYGNYIASENYEIVEFSNAPKTAKFAVKAQGESMKPLIDDGDILFINPDAQLLEGEIGIFTYQNNTYVKQLKRGKGDKLILHSLNSKFEDIVVTELEEFYTCGRVL